MYGQIDGRMHGYTAEWVHGRIIDIMQTNTPKKQQHTVYQLETDRWLDI